MVTVQLLRRFSSAIKSIRNVGIIAHIDAGKTTTTERILFDSGRITTAGEVDKGTTVTDYLEEERKRGITILSATANLKWQSHSINLIDTPGHVDFTVEVERCLSVLDGAVTIIDGTKGVEAQTQTVWNQARTHRIPNIFYINKFDRKTCNLDASLSTIKQKLPNGNPILIHLPTYCQETGEFNGIINLIDLKYYQWDIRNRPTNNVYTEYSTGKLSESSEEFTKAIAAREKLVEALVNIDDGLIREEFLKLSNPGYLIPSEMINESLKQATISASLCPVIIGSSKLNVGVNLILDNIVDFLPDPTEKELPQQLKILSEYPNHVTGVSFKVIHDKIMGPITFMRIYTGELMPKTLIQNLTRENVERIDRVSQITGENLVDLKSASAGDIVAVSGLKETYTGDIMVDKDIPNYLFESCKTSSEGDHLITIPEPVIHATVEARSVTEIKPLILALEKLIKEDPSLTYKINEELHQIVIGGMGKLHLEIILDRIQREYNLPGTRFGKIKIAYKECPSNEFQSVSHVHQTGGSPNYTVTMELRPISENDRKYLTSKVSFDGTSEYIWNKATRQLINDVTTTLTRTLTHSGPLLRCPLAGVDVVVRSMFLNDNHPIYFTAKSSQTLALRQALCNCLKELVENHVSSVVMEPIMKLEVNFPHMRDSELTNYISNVVTDIQRKRGHLIRMESIDKDPMYRPNFLVANIPYTEAMDYSEVVRKLTSGHGSTHLQFSHYECMQSTEQDKLIKKKVYRSN